MFRVILGFFPACAVLRPPTIFQLNFFLDAIGCHQALGPSELLIVCAHGCVCVPLCFGVCTFFAYVWLAACLLAWLAPWLSWVAPVSVPVSGPGLCELQIRILNLTTIFGIAKVPADASESCCFMTFAVVLAVHHAYVWPWAHFLDFSTSFFFSNFFFAFLMGRTRSKISSKVKGGTLFRA